MWPRNIGRRNSLILTAAAVALMAVAMKWAQMKEPPITEPPIGAVGTCFCKDCEPPEE